MNWFVPEIALIAVHVAANVVWIGSILSVSVLVSAAPFRADPTEAGALARRVYGRLAAPAFGISFLAGAGRLALSPAYYLHAPWMHAKLAMALVVIGLHHALGAKARRLAGGAGKAAAGAGVMGAVLFLFAVGAVFFAVEKTMP